jgi:hypothetical protein
MTKAAAGRAQVAWSSSWLALPSFFVGLMLTDLRPTLGLWLGIAAALAAVLSLIWSRMPRWLAWLALGFALGVVGLYLLAWVQMMNPTPSSGSGSGSASPR